MVWELTAYDTEAREARSRSYTSSAITAELWEQIPRIQFSDSGHGLVFQARKHSGKRKPAWRHSEHATRELARLRTQRRARARLPSLEES